MSINCIVVLGPTASGKTRLAANLALLLDGEIISADSRQVYRGMNLGTGKDYQEYTINEVTVPTHLLDIRDAGYRYHIDEFRKDFFEAFNQIQQNGNVPVVCGGTGFYIDSVLRKFEYTSIPVNSTLRAQLLPKTYDELLVFFEKMPHTSFTSLADTSTSKRLIRAIEINTYLYSHIHVPEVYPNLQPIVVGLDLPVEMRRAKIAERLKKRLEEGLIEEVVLLRKTLSDEQLEYYGLEYKFITHYLQGKLSLNDMQQKLTIAIQQFAKRQMTYFRKMERDGLSIHWIDATEPLSIQLDKAKELMTQFKI